MPNVTNPVILKLAGRVRLEEEPAMTVCLPHRRPARFTIRLNSGETFQAAMETNRGDWSALYPPKDIRDNFMSFTTRLWHENNAAA